MNPYYLIAVIICLLVIFISVTVWNLVTLDSIKKMSIANANNIQDAKYYELKFNIQFLLAIFTIIITVFSTIGYTSLTVAKEEIKRDLIRAADSAKLRIERIEPQLSEAENTIVKYKALVTQLNFLQNNIKDINSKNILKQSYYIVSTIKFTVSGPEEYRKINFKDLKTNLGDRLPEFTTPPIIIPAPDEVIPVMIFDISNTSFSVAPYGVQLGERNPFDGKPIIFSILVLEK
jgi:hypothetical protein